MTDKVTQEREMHGLQQRSIHNAHERYKLSNQCVVISKLLRPGFRQQGNLRGSRVLHNSAALPKAFALCHSSEFSKVKQAGEEQRKEQTE